MAIPTSRSTFKEYCLRKLGKGAIDVEVTDEQVDDRIDEALRFWWDYYSTGSEKIYYKYQITEEDQVNKYITLPENIIGAVRIFDMGSLYGSSSNMFNIQYQIALNDLYSLTSVSLVPYYMVMQHLQLMEQIIVGQVPIRYNRHTNKLSLDMNWSRYPAGTWIVVEAYEVIDPDLYTDAYGDRILQNYATALIKKQWGNNLKKFNGVALLGGVTLNGQEIFNEAVDEIKELEENIIKSWSIPCQDFIG